MKIPMIKPDVGRDEAEAAWNAVFEGELGAKAHHVTEFEEQAAAYFGKKYAVATNSGYSALLIALRAVKEVRGITEITLPVFTMIATATAAKHAGLKLNFVDVSPMGLLEGTYDVVMPVDVYGNQSNATGNVVIEDAAEYVGPFDFPGLVTCFSMNINKSLTTGMGGICVTDDEEVAKQMKLFANHYYDGKSYVHDKDGYHVQMSGLHAAVAKVQLRRSPEILEMRQILGERYVNALKKAWKCETYWYQPYLCDSVEEKHGLKAHLEAKDIACRDFFPPITNNPPFSNGQSYPVAEDLYARGLLLPVYSTMTFEEQDYIIQTILDYYQ